MFSPIHLYWHMNFHIEHHMYAAVPCYNLGKLHALIEHDLPRSSNGLYETWKEIIAIMRRQKVEPEYQYIPELPAHSAA
ncbi:fatty acid desaturase [Chloroflexi bacterium TSY]|nr:fatty acid desaturase [Chloroflexi bacterium TSY]